MSSAQIGPLKIGIVGGGRMGSGIAYMLARSGHSVGIFDTQPASLGGLQQRFADIAQLLGDDPASLNDVAASATLADIVAGTDLIIEAAPEKLELKQSLFEQFDTLAPAHAIFASNTSAIPIASIAKVVADKSRVIGAHFWNPPHLVRLVEVVQSHPDSGPTVARAMEILDHAGWTPVHLKKDIPGFVGNRMQHALKREAIALVAAGVCDAETVDTVVKMGFGGRLGVIGPLEQSDMVGLELTKNIHDVLLPDLDVTPHTQDYLNCLIAEGHLGMKTGKGFREWTPSSADDVRNRLDGFLSSQARKMSAEKS